MAEGEYTPATCDDYNGTEGCGEQIRLIKNEQGKWERATRNKVPCITFEGNVEYRYIPHNMVCTAPKGEAYRENWRAYQPKEQDGETKKPAGSSFRKPNGGGGSYSKAGGGGFSKNTSARGKEEDIPF